LRDIGRQFGVSKSSVDRHKKEHLPSKLIKAAETHEIVQAGSLLDQLLDINKETKKVLKEMRTAGDEKDNRGALFALRRLEKQLELQAHLLGQLGPSNQVNVAVLNAPSMQTAPEWPILMRVLDRYPEVRQELTDALSEAKL
jgi:hypothetical protein